MITRITRVLCLFFTLSYAASAALIVVPASGTILAGAQYSDSSLTDLIALDLVGASPSAVYDTNTSTYLGDITIGDPTFGGLFGTPVPPNLVIAGVTTSLSDLVAFVIDISAFSLYNSTPATSLLLPLTGIAVGSPDPLLASLLSGPAFASFSVVQSNLDPDQRLYSLDFLVIDSKAEVPEPASFLLVGLGLPLLFLKRFRRN